MKWPIERIFNVTWELNGFCTKASLGENLMTVEKGYNFKEMLGKMRVPVIAAPMFLVSGPDLVTACCRSGVIGSFPTINARTPEILNEWLIQIKSDLEASPSAMPAAVNLVVHRTNERLAADLDLVVEHQIPLTIASVGNPTPVVERVHQYGGIVLADVATVRHARLAIDAGVDGLILLCGGAGGNTGWLNPFAFVADVREFYDGPLGVAGSIACGRAIRAIEVLGADFAYIGTHFISATESMAVDGYREMIVESKADDIKLTDEVTGIPANFLRPSMERAGFKPTRNKNDAFSVEHELEAFRAWKDVWSAGQAVGRTKKICSVETIVAELESEYRQLK